MNQVISTVISFIKDVLAIAIFCVGLTVLTGELKFAVIKKVSQGSIRLSTFTQQMTKKNYP